MTFKRKLIWKQNLRTGWSGPLLADFEAVMNVVFVCGNTAGHTLFYFTPKKTDLFVNDIIMINATG